MRLLALAAAAATLAACTALPPRNDDVFARVELGMTRDATQRLLGRPDETMRFPGTRSESWDYFYQDGFGYYSAYSVTFGPAGTVVAKLTRRLNDGGDHGSP